MSDILETIKTITDLAKKGMTIELKEKIMELREEVVSLKEENLLLRSENLELKKQIDGLSKGEPCPRCRKPTWTVTDSRPHPHFGSLGAIERTYKCSECGLTEKRTITATGDTE